MIDRLVQYLRDTLNVAVTVRRWDQGERLPVFLRDEYAYHQAKMHGVEFLLMVDVSEAERPPSIVGKHLEMVRAKWDGEVVYVREQVSAYIRKRLIQAGIQFIVPGNCICPCWPWTCANISTKGASASTPSARPPRPWSSFGSTPGTVLVGREQRRRKWPANWATPR